MSVRKALTLFAVLATFGLPAHSQTSVTVDPNNTPQPIVVLQEKDAPADYNTLLQELDRLIKAEYVHSVPPDQKLIYRAAKGLVQALGDSHSVFLTPEETKLYLENSRGKFSGIGIKLVLDKGYPLVKDVSASGPADKAGLKVGDYILKINNEDLDGFTLTESIIRVRGQAGTEVVLTVVREGESKPLDIKIQRADIQPPDMHGNVYDKDGYVVIRVPHFGETTFSEVRQAIVERRTDLERGVVIDMRGNPGGLIDVCASMLGLWLDIDKVFWMAKSRAGETSDTIGQQLPYTWREKDVYEFLFSYASLKNVPTVVLVDGFSASAAEIFAGAAQDHGFAKVIGEKTFGKGSAQSLMPFLYGSSLKLTTRVWKTPNGHDVDKVGITPDIIVASPEKKKDVGADNATNDVDPQLDRAIEYLKTGK